MVSLMHHILDSPQLSKHDCILKDSISDPVIELMNTLRQRSGPVQSLTLQQQEYVRSIGC